MPHFNIQKRINLQRKAMEKGTHCGETEKDSNVCPVHNIKCKHIGKFSHCYVRINNNNNDNINDVLKFAY